MKLQSMLPMAGIFFAPHTFCSNSAVSASGMHRLQHHVRSAWKSLGMNRLQERGSKLTVRTMNANGRLTKIVEPDAFGKPAFTTVITYDNAGKVTSITQHGAHGDAPRERIFTYDARSM